MHSQRSGLGARHANVISWGMSTDLFAEFDPAPRKPRVLSVTEVTKVVRAVLEDGVGDVWVEGEVSNYRKQSSGHRYFTLKDASSQLSCVLFARPGAWRREVPLQDGMQVQVQGRLTVYEARGQYQLNVQTVQAAGAGLLQAKFEALKKKLGAEGLFDAARKRPLPMFPTTIALITSPTGAALRDMLNILSRRAPWLRLIVSPVRVQGEGAAEAIVAALAELNAWAENDLPRADVIVIGRGGGSAEDLWEFNEEVLARAIVASVIPVVSAVGHEIDFTIADFVADLRAPTPSAAAELIAPDVTELSRRLGQWILRMHREVAGFVGRERHRLANLATGTLLREPRAQLDAAAQKVDLASEALARALREQLSRSSQRLADLSATLRHHRPDQHVALRRQQCEALRGRFTESFRYRLETLRQRLTRGTELLRLLSPDATLERGYSITRNADGTVVRSVKDPAKGTRLRTRLRDGEIESIVDRP
jgi:exodeoxyribonuclease VII large subunit